MCFEGSGFWILGRRFRVLVLVYGIQGSEFRVLGFQGLQFLVRVGKLWQLWDPFPDGCRRGFVAKAQEGLGTGVNLPPQSSTPKSRTPQTPKLQCPMTPNSEPKHPPPPQILKAKTHNPQSPKNPRCRNARKPETHPKSLNPES